MVQGRDVCSARKMLGLSQEKLAEALGVSRNTISRWERGECSPHADKLAELERMLAQLETPTVPEDTPSGDTLTPKEAEAPPLAAPAKAKRWPMILVCAGVVCALLIGIAALIGVYSINKRLEPDNIVPAEEIEGEEVDSFQIEFVTRQPLQP